MLKESDFPTIDEIAACLEHIPARVEPDMREHESEEPCIDVRLQVWDAEDGGGWTVHTGDASYDHAATCEQLDTTTTDTESEE